MIYINRNSKDEYCNLIRPTNQWFLDAGAITTVALIENGNHNFDPNIYGHDIVRASLEKLFHDKCAYCESILAEWEVEHFRPKGRVLENPKHPGYFWLAYEWKNLYPACTSCNQRRRDKPIWGDLRYGLTGGKGVQFPLEDETSRAMKPSDDISRESNLLIDPCIDGPSLYMTYGIDGQIISINNNNRADAQCCPAGILHVREVRDISGHHLS